MKTSPSPRLAWALLPLLVLVPVLLCGQDRATFSLGTATAAPGQVEVSIPLSINVGTEPLPIGDWSAVVGYDPEVIGEATIVPTRENEASYAYGPSTFYEPGTIGIVVLNSPDGPAERLITSDNDGVVAELRFCVLADAAAGTYPIELDVSGDGAPRVGNAYETADPRVSGPIVLLEAAQPGRGEDGGRPLETPPVRFEEVLREDGDVVLATPQGRYLDLHSPQAEEEVPAEPPRLGKGPEVLAR